MCATVSGCSLHISFRNKHPFTPRIYITRKENMVKALIAHKAGGELQIGEWEKPVPKGNEILVKNKVVALNPVDWKQIKYNFAVPQWPFVVGADTAGVVEAVGPDVKNLKPGDKVFAFAGVLVVGSLNYGTYAEYSLLVENLSAKVLSFRTSHITNSAADYGWHFVTRSASIDRSPRTSPLRRPRPLAWARSPLPSRSTTFSSFPARASISPSSAPNTSSYVYELYIYNIYIIYITPLTQHYSTHTTSLPSQIWGGSSSTGNYAIQLAKLSGYTVITTASPHQHAYLQELGADVVIDRSDPEAVTKIREITRGRLRYAYDTISSATADLAAQALDQEHESHLAVIAGAPTGSYPKVKVHNVVSGVIYREEANSFGVSFYEELGELLAAGVLRPNRYEVLPNGLAGIPEGHARLAAGKVSGVKLVARIDETP
ncbi:chaperonin 10-like protein [Jimgerdemannia flammicorona]|uniref:Chaperonin 10-like protein n=1 Tax=Jimgerdemannia flammicorona TaxID=994334 RepID=A0A433A1B1_9FUNG|nr:chaperonin 10-like protein [Jimgerdemannia flammicorona]